MSATRQKVVAHLKQHGLDDYIDKLLEAGYDRLSDLAHASVDDLVAVGMKKPHAQRLIRSLSADASAAPSPSPAKPSSSSSSSSSSSRPNPPFSSSAPPLEDVDVLIGVNKVDPKLVATVRKYDLLAKLGNVTSKPVQLVDGDHDTLKFTVKKEGTDLLRGIKNDIVVIACAGVYRSGKSYLLNRLFGSTSAFALGPYGYSETKGLWLWKGPTIEWDDGRKRTFLLLDCEGMGGMIAIDKTLPFPERLAPSNLKAVSPQYDARLFAISMLVSSYFMLNSKSVADTQTLDKLKGLAQLSRYVAPEVGKEGECPRLMWVLRDVTLDIGRDADKYVNGVVNDGKVQVPVRALRDMFSKIGGFAMPKPVDSENRLAHMEKVLIENVRPQFNEFIELLQQRVFGEAQPKQRKSKNGQARVSGAELADLLEHYVAAVNSGKALDVQSVWESVALGKCREVGDNAVATYKRAMERTITTGPLTTQGFMALHRRTTSTVLAEFESSAPESDAKGEIYADVFVKRIGGMSAKGTNADGEGLFRHFRAENEKKSLQKCEMELTKVVDLIKSQIKIGVFGDVTHGLQRLEAVFAQSEAAIRVELDDQPRLGEALSRYMQQKAEVMQLHRESLKAAAAASRAAIAREQARQADMAKAAVEAKAAAEAQARSEAMREKDWLARKQSELLGAAYNYR
jgi:hypothetical protein